MVPCTQCSVLRQVKDPGHPSINRVCTRLPVAHHSSHMAVTNTRGCFSMGFCMGTLGNVPLAYVHWRYTVAALSCIQWKVYLKYHVMLCQHVTNKYTNTRKLFRRGLLFQYLPTTFHFACWIRAANVHSNGFSVVSNLLIQNADSFTMTPLGLFLQWWCHWVFFVVFHCCVWLLS